MNIFLFVRIGKKISSIALGAFLGLFLCFNQFFLFYSNQIAPYCLIFLIGTLLIESIIDFLKKPDNKNFTKLSLFNCLFIACDGFGFLYVLAEIVLFYLLSEKKQHIKKAVIKLSYHAFVVFLVMFVFYLIQYAKYSKMLIPPSYNGIGFNFSSLYLMLNEYFTPYLSFTSYEYQTKSTMGMLYSFFLNPDLKNINSLKIAITLFYSSILPLVGIILFNIKALQKEYKLRILFFISSIDFILILLMMMYEKIEMHPIFIIQFFLTSVILLGYGIFKIEDKLARYLIIFCLFAIQLINPAFNAFNITVKKEFPMANVFNNFAQEYNLDKNDVVIMPYLGRFAKMYYKDLNFVDLDYYMLQTNGKDKIIKNLNNKKAKTMNKDNILFLLSDYLREEKTNTFLANYFLKECVEKNAMNDSFEKVILVVDKLNTRPVSKGGILKCANSPEYSSRLKKIDFRYLSLEQNRSKILYDALMTKTLFNFVNLLIANFYVQEIVEYKKIDNEYYKTIKADKNIFDALNSHNNDYLFIIFAKDAP